MLSVIMLSVTVFYCFAESRYAECPHAECRYDACRYAECRGTFSVSVISILVKYFRARQRQVC
jgi:hypothetical protein